MNVPGVAMISSALLMSYFILITRVLPPYTDYYASTELLLEFSVAVDSKDAGHDWLATNKFLNTFYAVCARIASEWRWSSPLWSRISLTRQGEMSFRL